MKKIIYNILISFILFLSLGIISKSSLSYRNKIHYYLYEDNLAFSSFRNFYNKYLGDIYPFNFLDSNVVSVFSEDMRYSFISKYFDGYRLKVDYNYLVPAIQGGIVTYVGEKKNYGNVIIVMGDDGVSIWYGNMKNYNLKLYDSVNTGDFIGEVDNDTLYLVFYDDEKYLAYDDFFN